MPVDLSPAPVTAAVSAPAPAAAAASPAAIPSPAPAAARVEANDFDKTFSDLDESAHPSAPAAPAAQPKPDKEAPAKPAETASTVKPKPAETDESAAEDDEFAAPQTSTVIELRNFGKRMAKMARQAQIKSKELEAKLKEVETRAPQMPPDVEKIQADYQRLVKENQEHRERLTRADYANSPEYEQKYKAPYQQAYTRGRSAVSGLKVKIINPETEEVTYRDGSAEDFDKLYNMTDSDADAAAEAMFGPSARRVVALRDTAKERAEMAYLAIQENTAKFAETKQQEAARSSSQKLALQGLWKKTNDDLQAKHPDWFGEREDDKEWNEGLAKGTAIANQRFTEQYLQLAPEQRVVLDAQIFNRTRAFTPMRLLIARQAAELAEAKKTIEQLRGSGPGKPTPGAAQTETVNLSDEDEGKRRGIF